MTLLRELRDHIKSQSASLLYFSSSNEFSENGAEDLQAHGAKASAIHICWSYDMSATSTILAATSIAASVAGTGMTMMGQQQQARAQAASAQYQAAVARNNQQVAEWQAQDALERGREREN